MRDFRFSSIRSAVIFFAASVMTGCASNTPVAGGAAEAAAFQKVVVHNWGTLSDTNILPILLTATLVNPAEIDLQWHCRVPDAAGCFIDSNSGTNLRFELLGAVLSPVTTFDHRELKPDTRYGYRIIPFFGPPSDVVKFTTGESAKIAAKAMNAVPGRASPGRRGIFSVRSRATAAKAAPSDLTATGLAPRMAELKWRDNSRDEEGYLVEVSEGSPRHFRVMAVLRPNTISFPTPLLPPKTACYFRVRAYCTGGPSLALELTTHPR